MSDLFFSLPPVVKLSIKYDRLIPSSEMVIINGAEMATAVFRETWNLDHINYLEEFKVMFLNNANKLLGIMDHSMGGQTGTLVDVRIMLATALTVGSNAILLCHNHPTGKLKPSGADKQLTQKLFAAAELMDIRILDHIILTDESFYSFSDDGIMPL